MLIQLVDCRELGYCSRGIRKFCLKHGISYTTFLRDGIDSEKLLELNDSMATKIVENKRGKQ